MTISAQGVTTELIATSTNACLLPADGMLGGKAEASDQQDYK